MILGKLVSMEGVMVGRKGEGKKEGNKWGQKERKKGRGEIKRCRKGGRGNRSRCVYMTVSLCAARQFRLDDTL